MSAREVKLYPTPQEFQKADEDEVPLSWAIGQLQRLLKNSEADTQVVNQTQKLRGWKGVAVFHDRVPTNDELLAERVDAAKAHVERVRNRLEAGITTGGLTVDQLKAILQDLGQF